MEQVNNYSPLYMAIEIGDDIADDCDSWLTFQESFVDRVMAGDSDDSLVEDPGLLSAIEKTERDVSYFCTSVRTAPDSIGALRQWRKPQYKDKMMGVSNIIENQCKRLLTVSTIITHIADWFLFRSASGDSLGPLSVKIKMKEMDDIMFNDCFVSCYFEMKGLYEREMLREKKKSQKNFEDYFEDLIESWALVDMTATMVNKEGYCFISIVDLLAFATTRARLFSVLERLTLHHFQDSWSGGARSYWTICQKKNERRLTDTETEFLEKYRQEIQQRGNDEYDEPVSGIDGSLYENTNRDLLLQLRSVQKLHRDTGRSSKRKNDCINPPSGVIHQNPSLPLTSIQTITDEAESDDDDNIEDIAFTERLQSFLDPAFIKRIQNPTALEDMVEWDRRYKLVKAAYQRETGAIDY
jgi:hypothetical protein